MAKNSLIGVVIVSYNSADELTDCIKSVSLSVEAAGCNSLVIVVDNNSSDNSIDISNEAGAKVIANDVNKGFAAAVNQGIKEAFSLNAEYILILNPDVIMSPECMGELIKCFNSDSQIGGVGPNLIDEKGKPAPENYYQKAPSWISVALFSTFLHRYFVHSPFFVHRFYREYGLDKDKVVDQIPGACLFTSRGVLEEVGLLDEDFAIWFEDVEWCYRARKKGYKMWYCSTAKVEHEGGTTFERWESSDKAVTFHVSMKTFFNKHKPVSGIIVRAAIVLNALVLFLKNHKKEDLIFIKRFMFEKRGLLPK